MKSALRICIVLSVAIVFLGIALGCLNYFVERGWAWTRLPNGDKIQIYSVQDRVGIIEEQFTPLRYRVLDVFTPIVSIFTLADESASAQWNALLGPRPIHYEYKLTEKSIIVSLRVKHRSDNSSFPWLRCWTPMPDGQEFRSWAHPADSNGTDSLIRVQLYFVPRSLEAITMRFEDEAATQTVTLRVANPRSSTRPSKWRAEPLPQSKSVDNLMVTLENVTSRFVPMPAPNDTTWLTDVHYKVTALAGEEKSKYDYWAVIQDEDGHSSSGRSILSQPVCKVVVRITPRDRVNVHSINETKTVEFYIKPPSKPVQPSNNG